MHTLMATYDVKDLIGKGAFGTVRASTSRTTGGAYALKSVRRPEDEELRAALVSEIEIQVACDHPNIARVYEVFENPTWTHVAMEVCKGGDLFSLLQERESLGETEAGLVMRQVLRAVRYLHGVRHVVHRDIKTENLLLRYQGVPLADNVVKVIDFGFAEFFTPGKRELTWVCGTSEYMAPEIGYGPYDEKCDIWSCGILLYELLTGDYPFSADTPARVRRLVKVCPLPLEGALWDSASCEVQELLLRLCCKDPLDRWSAEEALRAPWFEQMELVSPSCFSRTASPDSPNPSQSIAENLRAFSSCSSFQKVVLRVAARHLDSPTLEQQRAVFELLDKNGDGQITPEEVEGGCPELGLAPAEATALFRELDVDGNGAVEYSEFLGAAISRENLTDRAYREAFRFCDWDNTGAISAKNIKELTPRTASGYSRFDGHITLAKRGHGHMHEDLDFDGFVSMLRCSPRSGA